MSGGFFGWLRSVLAPKRTAPARPKTTPQPAPKAAPRPGATPQPGTTATLPPAKGQSGPTATVEVAANAVGRVRTSYSPNTDGDPDPGEVIWTWVPYEERDGRGKDRPVLVVAVEPAGTVLAVQLTSKDHTGRPGYVGLGAGAWDGEHRPSWVNTDRVFRVHATGMRREATALDRKRYGLVQTALRERYGWK